MARHNFHDAVFGEPAFQDLLLEVGCKYKARGMLLVAFELGQKYWLEHKGVPTEKWPADLEPLFRWGFAKREVREDAEVIYVSGSREHFKFLDSQAEKGKKGGRSKSAKKTANLRQYAKKSEAEPKPSRSPENPTEVSISSSTSISLNLPKTSSSGAAASLPAPRRGKNAIALWLEAYHRKYGVRYELTKKDQGILKHFEDPRSEEQMVILFACYLAIKEQLYESQKHPLSLFFRDLPKISVAAQTGVDPSLGEEPEWKKQVREEEERNRNAAQ